MKPKTRPLTMLVFFSLVMLLISAGPVQAGQYEALRGADRVDTVFDFREGDPAGALVHLSLAHETFKDKALRKVSETPRFAVVFMGGAVRLLSSDRSAFTAEQKKTLEQMDGVISKMVTDGIKLEVCRYAVDFFGVDPESISSEIDMVPNGWISSIGYQANGYALVPIF